MDKPITDAESMSEEPQSFDPPEEWDRELLTCPECGDSVALTEPIESMGEGVAFGYLACESCTFAAREEWVIDKTVRR